MIIPVAWILIRAFAEIAVGWYGISHMDVLAPFWQAAFALFVFCEAVSVILTVMKWSDA